MVDFRCSVSRTQTRLWKISGDTSSLNWQVEKQNVVLSNHLQECETPTKEKKKLGGLRSAERRTEMSFVLEPKYT
jgi:hypothetical protein